MNKSDIEMLSAYLDNELSEAERSHFEERLATDEVLAEAFTKYSENDQVYREAFSAIDETPVPDSILSLISESEKDVLLSNQHNVVELKKWRRVKWLPIAASFLIIALSLPVLFNMNEPDSPSVASVLDSQLSGQKVEIAATTNLELVMSFIDQQGHLCREYVLSQSNSVEQKIACKIDGMWQTQISDTLYNLGGNHYQVASSGGSDKIENWLDLNMSGIPLSTRAEEAALNRSAPQEK
ncbi:hypothetical protein KJ365_04310 [Glaciecola sp. XM2]|uniref:anti-sigma factor family protein n=1 Tax=Glaciecola sp. XM2 TaxID=1914931 RepID=UPI001BDF6CDF|nr:hypothetical protein [Glaciecola sp. XM2]MBT1450092.1 hypothetical protein [Glaciecola sp. XM2]